MSERFENCCGVDLFTFPSFDEFAPDDATYLLQTADVELPNAIPLDDDLSVVTSAAAWTFTDNAPVVAIDDPATATPVKVLTLRATSSGVPAAGLGPQVSWETEDQGGNARVAALLTARVTNAGLGTAFRTAIVQAVIGPESATTPADRVWTTTRGQKVGVIGGTAGNATMDVQTLAPTGSAGYTKAGLLVSQGADPGGGAAGTVVSTQTLPTVHFDLDSTTKTWNVGDVVQQAEVLVDRPTFAATGASLFEDAATARIRGAPVAGAGVTFTTVGGGAADPYALWLEQGPLRVDGGVLLGAAATGARLDQEAAGVVAARTWLDAAYAILRGADPVGNDDLTTKRWVDANTAPPDADYLVRTATGELSAERVVTDTASVIWDWATAGQAKATVPDASTTAKGIAEAATDGESAALLYVQANDSRLVGGSGLLRAIVKLADEARRNSTTPTADSELFLSIVAGGVYQYEVGSFWDQDTAAMGVKWSLTASGGADWATYSRISTLCGTGTLFSVQVTTSLPSAVNQTAASPGNLVVFHRGGFKATADGLFSVDWSQNTNDAVNFITMLRGSYLKLWRTS